MNVKQHWKKLEKNIIFRKNKINIIESCVDRNAKATPDKLALVFQGEGNKVEKFSYAELETQVNKFANLLKSLGVRKKSRVFIFLPKVSEMYIAILGTIKHGSIAAPLFEAFQKDGLELRLQRGDVQVLVTNRELVKRVSKTIKKRVSTLKYIMIVDTPAYKNAVKKQSNLFEPVLMNRKDTSLLIFTSSTAGTPVAGIQIPHQGLIQQHFTGNYSLGLTPESQYWCTAHPGWVDRKSTRLNSSHIPLSRMPSSA